MTRLLFTAAFLIGAIAVTWMGSYFIGSDKLALAVTVVIGCVYTIGFLELVQFRRATSTLPHALSAAQSSSDGVTDLGNWLSQLDPSLQNAVRLRIEGERVGLPAPAITPYLVGLLVMLGLLGTFVGMVETLKGAVFALEGTTELQAIRAGLAAPINGLSLAFGTSVAGVAASAMLGLASTISRRDRMLATRQLDDTIASVFRVFSLVHNRQETYKALQMQAQSLPDVALTLHTLAEKLEQMGDKLGDKLVANQTQFLAAAESDYKALSSSVDQSLNDSLAQSGRMAGESIKPLLEDALAGISQEALNTHQQLSATAQQQLQSLSEQFSGTSAALLQTFETASAGWLERQQSTDAERLTQWTQTLQETHQDTSSQLQSNATALTAELAAFSAAQQKTLAATSTALASTSASMAGQSQQAAQQLEQLTTTVGSELGQLREEEERRNETAAQHLAEQSHQAAQQLEQLTTTVGGELSKLRAEEEQRSEAAAQRLSGQSQQAVEQLEQLTTTIGGELGKLREEEERRSEAAAQRLAGLEATVATHLATLGKELEEPMTQLIQTASETPKAAAEVIGHLRNEISKNIERDNALLEERQQLMQQLETLSQSLGQASADQQNAIEGLVSSSTSLLQDVGGRFNEEVSSGLSGLSEMTDHFSSSAVQMSSLGDAFSQAVQLFNDSNSGLVEHLARIEQAMEQSSSRSDEQMGYYVAQAREIIDQSMMSQREVFEELRQLTINETLAPAEAS